MVKLLLFGLAALAASASPHAFASAIGSAKELNALDKLFQPAQSPSNPARNTFIIALNGDSDHFVTADSLEGGKLVREDKYESDRIQAIANSCSDCNIVFLHAQRGQAHWYTANGPWATYLRVYSRGQKLLERTVSTINLADPEVNIDLIKFANGLFGSSNLHLIYRGHSFLPAYAPASSDGIAPFDYEDPESPYGPDQFVQSMQSATSAIGRPLSSVVLAACRMSYFDLTARLSKSAKYFVATQVDVLESLDVGFDYQAVSDTKDAMSEHDVASLLAQKLLDRFDSVADVREAMMEYPTTLFDLTGADDLKKEFDSVLKSVLLLIPRALTDPLIVQSAGVERRLSKRYLESLKAGGKSNSEISATASFVRVPSPASGDLDVIGFLSAVGKDTRLASEGALLARIRALSNALDAKLVLRSSSPYSKMSGLSFLAADYQ